MEAAGFTTIVELCLNDNLMYEMQSDISKYSHARRGLLLLYSRASLIAVPHLLDRILAIILSRIGLASSGLSADQSSSSV